MKDWEQASKLFDSFSSARMTMADSERKLVEGLHSSPGPQPECIIEVQSANEMSKATDQSADSPIVVRCTVEFVLN